MDAIHLGNDRPLIPLQINPPDHLKYRKLLDPLFAPREINKLEDEVRKLANELVDAFIDAGDVEYSEAFAIPLPCTVFLALMKAASPPMAVPSLGLDENTGTKSHGDGASFSAAGCADASGEGCCAKADPDKARIAAVINSRAIT